MILNLFNNEDMNFVESDNSYFSTIPPYDGYKFLGWTKDATIENEDELGYLSTDGNMYIPVFIKNFSLETISNETDREQIALDSGKNCAILIYGSGDVSYVMRYTSKELKHIDLSFFNDKDVFDAFWMEN